MSAKSKIEWTDSRDIYLMAEMDPSGDCSRDCFDRWIVDDLISLGFTIRESLGDAPAHDPNTVFEMGRVLPIDRGSAEQIIWQYSRNGIRVMIDEKKMNAPKPNAGDGEFPKTGGTA